MKGAYSDPEDKLERLTQSLLFPDNPYFYDSGGDPAIIPVRCTSCFTLKPFRRSLLHDFLTSLVTLTPIAFSAHKKRH
jgi:hypothetical protein